MSDPQMSCLSCGRTRSCLRHLRAAFPPAAAWRWLQRSCPAAPARCVARYQAGIEPGLTLEGQARGPEREETP